MRILASESGADILLAENVAEQSTGAGAADGNDNANTAALQQAIRLAVLQLFIKNTEAGRPYPNIAHFFLFGDTKTEHVIQDPHALGAHRTCIHVILDLANIGVPRLDARDDPGPESDPLFLTLPGLAELFYRIVYQLCTHSRTSEFTMRYLRTREDFFTRQLAAIPSQVPPTLQDKGIEVMYADGARVLTTVPALSSFLRLRSWIFDLAALDLHVLTSKGHFKGVAELLDILFGNDSDVYPGSQDGFREVGQSHLRIIEFVQSLAFDWADTLKVDPMEMYFLGQLNLHSCVRRDATGCEIIDRTALLSLLTTARRMLHTQNSVVTPAHGDQLNAETTYILESCAVENHRREVAHAKSAGYESWKRLLDMTLTKCFNRLPHDHRENMLFDLLHVLPTILRSEDIQESTAVLLSEAVLSAVTKLREDRRHQVLVQSASGDADAGSLPAERLYAILRNILECIVDSNRVELVRGNLYAAMINYVHLITPSSDVPDDHKVSGLSMSLAASTNRDDFLFNESQALVPVSQSGRPPSSAVSLELGSLSLMKGVMERLIATISRDAIDGSEVWKTVAFMLLDSLVQLSGLEKQHIVLSALVRHGILTNFVRGIKESDLRLQAVLKPDPGKLSPGHVIQGN
jgi:nuclear pore complex protein Nup205